jgi:tRNA A-37 threonylcarbamoyl transferase component Bud32
LDQTILEVHHRISQKKTFRDRARLGNRGDFIEIEDNQIIKADKLGEDNAAWEFEVLVALEELGITPKPAVEEGVFGHPNSFQMEKINDGTTLEEYLEEFLLGTYSHSLFLDLCAAIGKMLNIFWEAGWVHTDLHAKNIVIDINWDQPIWTPYLIDFGTAFHNDLDHPLGRKVFAEEKMTILQELPSSEDDLDFLDSAFTMIFEIMRLEENPRYWKGLRTLKNQIVAF